MRVATLVVLLSLMAFGSATAQTPSPFGIEVTAVFDSDSERETLKRQVLDVFEHELRQRGIPEAGEHQITLLIDAREAGALTVLSVTAMQALPRTLIEQGARGQAFFYRTAAEDLPDEGAHIRELASREWLEQFHTVMDQELVAVDADDVEAFIQEYVARLPAGR